MKQYPKSGEYWDMNINEVKAVLVLEDAGPLTDRVECDIYGFDSDEPQRVKLQVALLTKKLQ